MSGHTPPPPFYAIRVFMPFGYSCPLGAPPPGEREKHCVGGNRGVYGFPVLDSKSPASGWQPAGTPAHGRQESRARQDGGFNGGEEGLCFRRSLDGPAWPVIARPSPACGSGIRSLQQPSRPPWCRIRSARLSSVSRYLSCSTGRGSIRTCRRFLVVNARFSHSAR